MSTRFLYTLCLFVGVLLSHTHVWAKEEAKKLLFIMNTMNIGGTERSLINLLNNYPDKSAKLFVYLLKRGGALEEELLQNPQVQIIDQKKAYKDSFDVAISYIFTPSLRTSCWVDEVKAKRRIQWIHTDEAFFRQIERDVSKNKKEHKKIDAYITVSKASAKALKKQFPQFKENVYCIYNIFDAKHIREQAVGVPEDMIINDGLLNIVTVARLAPGKGIDKAIRIHQRLEEYGIHFRWYVVGDGTERPELEALIKEAGLKGKFILLGSRVNPYPYIKAADAFALLSSSEGFGMVVTEAKILQKPILVTNFAAAQEQITNGVDGLIVKQDDDSIYAGVEQMLLNQELREKFAKVLEGFTFDNDSQYEKMQRIFFE